MSAILRSSPLLDEGYKRGNDAYHACLQETQVVQAILYRGYQVTRDPFSSGTYEFALVNPERIAPYAFL